MFAAELSDVGGKCGIENPRRASRRLFTRARVLGTQKVQCTSRALEAIQRTQICGGSGIRNVAGGHQVTGPSRTATATTTSENNLPIL